jgi:hypothetical protein
MAKTLKNLERSIEEARSACSVATDTLSRPTYLDQAREDCAYQGYSEAMYLAYQIQEYYFSIANREFGHMTQHDISPECCDLEVISNNGANWVGMAKWNNTMKPNTIAIAKEYLSPSQTQWHVLTETVPHEVAHIVWNQLRKAHSYSDQIKLGFRTKTGRFSSHGLLWKEIFKRITGFKKINNRYFGMVTR